MNHNVFIYRSVSPESAPALDFRKGAIRRFRGLGLKAVNTINLHATVARYHNFAHSVEDLASAMRTQPETSTEHTANPVTAARVIGRNRLAGTASFALTLDSPELIQGHQHYVRLLGETRTSIEPPHVTLLKATNIHSHDDIAEITQWMEERMPDTIGFNPVSIAWSMWDDKDDTPASRLAS